MARMRLVSSQMMPPPTPPANQTPIGRDEVIREYEAKLSTARWYAHFVGYCNLTWATVVLLGGYCSDLHVSDLWSVVVLLLVEAARLATATFFTILLNRSLTDLDQNLPDLAISPDPHRLRHLFTRFFSGIAQYGFNFVVLFIAGARIRHLDSYSHVDSARNLHRALSVFYYLLFANSMLNSITISVDYLKFDPYLREVCPNELSLIRYYEYIIRNFLCGTRGLADPIDFFHFAYVVILGREFQRNVQTNLVVKEYGRMLEYLYAHRQGFDHLFLYLQYGDASVQQAAANVPGLWMSLGTTRDMAKSLREGLVSQLVSRLPENV